MDQMSSTASNAADRWHERLQILIDAFMEPITKSDLRLRVPSTLWYLRTATTTRSQAMAGNDHEGC